MKEHQAKHGDIIQSPNGNRYLVQVLKIGRVQFYVGNVDPECIPITNDMFECPVGECTVVGKVTEIEPEPFEHCAVRTSDGRRGCTLASGHDDECELECV